MRRTLTLLLLGALLCGTGYRLLMMRSVAAADGPAPDRKVNGTVLESTRDPKVRLELKPPIEYAGGERFVLYGVADCEIHMFFQADAQKKVQRLYWVQFEAYLPEVNASYKYDSPVKVTLGGLPFVVDGGVGSPDAPSASGSDDERAKNLLRARGYHFPAEMMFQRLVHLPDAKKRKELMIIYAEDLTPTGYTADELSEGGPKASEWPAVSKALLERAQAGIRVSR